MQLSKKILSTLNKTVQSVPSTSLFELPEKVLQFGTGVLLRGLPDYYIDKANKRGVFNGRIVVVKSTDKGGTDAFELQDGLYTQCIRGISNQTMTQEYTVNASVSRVLSAKSQWAEVLACASNPQMEVVISNTTEVGLVLVEDDNVKGQPPVSFPGKLLAFLQARYQHFRGDVNKGMVIIPTELIIDNGNKLQSIVIKLAQLNQCDAGFIDWLENANYFCSSLVDRIVPGKMPAAQQKAAEAELGYSDELMIMSEVYSLWAIESSNPKVKSVLSFADTDESVVITNDITKHRELKLRLLNGTHTLSCGVAFLAGFEIVKDAMENRSMSLYIHDLMIHEIAPCIYNENVSVSEALQFSNNVIERFSNPFIDHRWLSITLNYTYKIKMRNIPMLLKHYEQHSDVPGYMAIGFAAYLLFMKCEPGEDGTYYGKINDVPYLVQDDRANYYAELWSNNTLSEIPKIVLSNIALWGEDIAALPGFASAVQFYMESIQERGVLETLKAYQLNSQKAENNEA
jgi:tagaturonate reductase